MVQPRRRNANATVKQIQVQLLGTSRPHLSGLAFPYSSERFDARSLLLQTAVPINLEGPLNSFIKDPLLTGFRNATAPGSKTISALSDARSRQPHQNLRF